MPSRGRAAQVKGASFQRKVQAIFRDAGLDVRAFQRNKGGEGDTLIVADGYTFSMECKNQARLQVPDWWAQAAACAPSGAEPMLTFNLKGQTLTTLPTALLAELLAARGPA